MSEALPVCQIVAKCMALSGDKLCSAVFFLHYEIMNYNSVHECVLSKPSPSNLIIIPSYNPAKRVVLSIWRSSKTMEQSEFLSRSAFEQLAVDDVQVSISCYRKNDSKLLSSLEITIWRFPVFMTSWLSCGNRNWFPCILAASAGLPSLIYQKSSHKISNNRFGCQK